MSRSSIVFWIFLFPAAGDEFAPRRRESELGHSSQTLALALSACLRCSPPRRVARCAAAREHNLTHGRTKDPLHVGQRRQLTQHRKPHRKEPPCRSN